MISNGKRSYEVGDKLAEAKACRIYLCKDNAGRQLLLIIAKTVGQNGYASRAAYILKLLAEKSDFYEAEYSQQPEPKGAKVHYDWLFPELVDNFVCQEQGGRQVNILALRDVEVSKVFPLAKLHEREERVDLKTSAWIIGRLLKLLTFAHEQGVFVKNLTEHDILIGPERHNMTLLLWDEAELFEGKVPADTSRQDITSAAKLALRILGCDGEGNYSHSGYAEDEGGEYFKEYLELIRDMAAGKRQTAYMAFKEFYELIKQTWGRQYHPWKTIKILNERQ